MADRSLVTGAANGIGRATAVRLGAAGGSVALLDVDGPALARAAAEVEAAGGRALPVEADVRDEAAVERAVAAAVEAFGGLDAVIPNAAVQHVGRDDRADRLDAAVWADTLAVNLTGAFLTVKHGVRALLDGGGGAVVCVASPAGVYGIARGMTAYSASKAGLLGLVRVLAADLAREGVRVNAVFPGVTETPMNHWWTGDPARRAEVEAGIPVGRAATAAEVAEVVAFLAGAAASYVTGAIWTVDGGLTAV